MNSPASDIRAAVKASIADEWPTLDVRDDRLHGSLGQEADVAGVSPLREYPDPIHSIALEVEVLVQFYLRWDPQIDPAQTVDPAPIEAVAERLRATIRDNFGPGASSAWFAQVVSVEYPPDPTGNVTRLSATVRGYANNSSVV